MRTPLGGGTIVSAYLIDRIVVRMDEDTMPPPTAARPGHIHRDTIVERASCGLVHPDETVGLEVSR